MTDILLYFLDAITPFHLAITLSGTVVGIIIGALPGFTATMAIAVLIPITYTWDTTAALIFLGAIYCGSMFGGSHLRYSGNTPGTAARGSYRHGRLRYDKARPCTRSFDGVGCLLLLGWYRRQSRSVIFCTCYG